ncbi:DUF6929 family protein [Flavobacterium sp. N3904]|uniref:DUF6929 family protein n=1 Tax=Flavobacterium sp. N3904 TaxID=2986835 RepID=UPI002225445D|nr:hypothetical protein [Flavobacterium sp. N3904]
MKQFNLQPLFQISGIGSASGLVYQDNLLYIISDNSSYLYEYNIQEKKLYKIELFENSQENIPKANKFDFESITKKGNKLYLFGSGSTSKRNKRICYNTKNSTVKEKDVTHLYTRLKHKAFLNDSDLNLEGAFYNDYKWYFFQRGNGSQSQNGVFVFNKEKKDIQFTPVFLPKIQNIEATFTDAILVENQIYFLAAVENTISTYDDGEILGSYIGCLSLDTFKLESITLISDENKFEGLTIFKKTNHDIEFLLCEDNDTESLETVIYKLILPQ